MECFIWNSDGFGDAMKYLKVIEAIREHCLDFVVISETERSNFLTNLLNQMGIRLLLVLSTM
jgi:hypothetical protein